MFKPVPLSPILFLFCTKNTIKWITDYNNAINNLKENVIKYPISKLLQFILHINFKYIYFMLICYLTFQIHKLCRY